MLFDLHCHPSFKTFLSHRQQNKRKNCWTSLDFDLSFKILDSQSSFSQIKSGEARLIVCTLYALENGFARSGLIKLAAGLSPHVDKRFLQEIRKGIWGYQELMLGDYLHLLLSKKISPQKSFRILQSIDEYHPNGNAIQVILAVEGGHNFYHAGQHTGSKAGVLENLRFHKQAGNPRLLYLTLTHLQQSDFCTHAFGIKVIKNKVFNPAGRGLRPLGRALIREALSEINGPRIHIDVKHMSINTRLAYYRLRNREFPGAPIVASHMGVTGVSYLKKPVKKVQTNIKHRCVEVFYYRSLGVKDTYFNPWSINLYDEDIKEIMLSGGLIGLSLDQRILGCGNVSKEYYSMEEFIPSEFQLTDRPVYHKLPQKHHNTPKKKKDWQIRHFCNNWLHVIKIGHLMIGEDSWNHVCIGSDFDGLIDPVDDFKSAADYQFLFGRLVEWLPIMAQAAEVPLASDQVQDKVRDLMFNNALAFLNQHFV